MATILFSAVGAALGGAAGGTVAGLSTAVLGRAAGATLGRVIDERILGRGAAPVETGKVDRFRLTQAGDGAAIARVYGRMRVGGQVIWASDFLESSVTSGGGGKGAPSRPKTTRYSYSVSLAIAVCEGEIATIGRIWADGEEIAAESLNMRVYTGTQDQQPDPVIEAIEGAGLVPAYRGTAYVVLEDLQLEPFGNRVPQFSFEVLRAEQPGSPRYDADHAQSVRAVALVPGTGEYTLATEPVFYTDGPGGKWPANTNTPSGTTDFETSVSHLRHELPACQATSLVVSWFGGDLRCGECELHPKIEKPQIEGSNMPWQVSGVTRAMAQQIAQDEGRPIYGGTPSDQSVVQAIRHLNAAGQRVMFYPFILMDQQQGNGLPDPWSDATDQPHLPWRGRITLSKAPGVDGSPDGTAAATGEVTAFFGTVTASDFVVGDGTVTYTGPQNWGLRRFILHYAALCAAAGGVDAFCIGSELRGLTRIRDDNGFPAVQQLRSLAAEVRALLGAETRIGYAADWSEYPAYQPSGGGNDLYFHLDPLWADPNIDFIGIDNYMPLSDWRDGETHADKDAGWQSLYDTAYLRSNIEGGEGYDWYYPSAEARAAQRRAPITDGAYGEPWVWRYKDLRNWWGQPHHDRPNGVRSVAPTAWIPGSKPIWFTEIGCAAVDKGTNQPNKFIDPKSSETALPHYSNGQRDDLIQRQYLEALQGYWADPTLNPVSEHYAGRMVDTDNVYVWAWDVRPFPFFPNTQSLWSDGPNHARGHWLNGRVGARSLASVVEEICSASGLDAIDTNRLFGVVRGYTVDDVSDARSALQSLMLIYGFDAVERDGVLHFITRTGTDVTVLEATDLVETDELEGTADHGRDAEAELTGRVRLRFIETGADHEVVAEEAVLPEEATHAVAQNDVPIALTRGEGRRIAERWLTESRVSRETLRFALPPSRLALGAGDVIRWAVPGAEDGALYRVDQVEQIGHQLLEAVQIEPEVYRPTEGADDPPSKLPFAAPTPVLPLFLDLPLMTGDEVPHAPHLAVTATRWPGSVAVYASNSDEDYKLNTLIEARSVIGQTETDLHVAQPGLWDRGDAVQVKLISGALQSRSDAAVLGGANLMAIGDGSSGTWELFQFRDAELVGPSTYLLSHRLRGQLGTDALMPPVWPAGSWVVALDGTPEQIELTSAQRRSALHFRIGPSARGYDDPAYVHLLEAFDGIGLRPYAPVHLRASALAGGDLSLSWIRRTRIDGDQWQPPEIPLGEESESYRVRVIDGGTILREETVNAPAWIYTATHQAVDGAALPLTFEVAQISARFGAGLGRRLTVET